MRRPSDQAKVLFFAFLRSTVSALATSESKLATAVAGGGASVAPYPVSSAFASQRAHVPPPQQQPTITLRFARRTDVPSIQRCNLATLPENYNDYFYANHLRQWPDLALVAECTPAKESNSNKPYNTPFLSQSEPNIVAYVLGKVEDRPVVDEEALRVDPFGTPTGGYQRYERWGHVTSLAVVDGFRRQGLARELMQSLHHHLQTVYRVDAVGLHVRQSNQAAARLYGQFGYSPDERIAAYYQDGEDAFFMKKRLPQPQQQQLAGGGLFGNLRLRPKPWEASNSLCPDHLVLPRIVSSPEQQEEQREEEEEAAELMTGTM